jgi:16S rRNA (cytosine1402-N4)-methyltransferase
LLKRDVDGFDIKPDGYMWMLPSVAENSREILSRLGPEGKLYAFDQDQDALANTIDDERFVLINENFRFIKRFLRFYGAKVLMEF